MGRSIGTVKWKKNLHNLPKKLCRLRYGYKEYTFQHQWWSPARISYHPRLHFPLLDEILFAFIASDEIPIRAWELWQPHRVLHRNHDVTLGCHKNFLCYGNSKGHEGWWRQHTSYSILASISVALFPERFRTVPFFSSSHNDVMSDNKLYVMGPPRKLEEDIDVILVQAFVGIINGLQ